MTQFKFKKLVILTASMIISFATLAGEVNLNQGQILPADIQNYIKDWNTAIPSLKLQVSNQWLNVNTPLQNAAEDKLVRELNQLGGILNGETGLNVDQIHGRVPKLNTLNCTHVACGGGGGGGCSPGVCLK